jgi:mono/diheme cytochrome c family protein
MKAGRTRPSGGVRPDPGIVRSYGVLLILRQPAHRRWTALVSYGKWTMAFAACMLAVLVQTSAAQGPPPRSTKAGVYTEAQAAKGADTYSTFCQGCHTAASHTGGVFLTTWLGLPLSDLFEYISTEMPKTEPGSLPAQEYAQVLAYLLKLNAMPPGERELPADKAALKSIRFDTASIRKGR